MKLASNPTSANSGNSVIRRYRRRTKIESGMKQLQLLQHAALERAQQGEGERHPPHVIAQDPIIKTRRPHVYFFASLVSAETPEPEARQPSTRRSSRFSRGFTEPGISTAIGEARIARIASSCPS